MSKYTLDAGRCIVRDGVAFATIHGIHPYSPTELDQFARRVVACLNLCEGNETVDLEIEHIFFGGKS